MDNGGACGVKGQTKIACPSRSTFNLAGFQSMFGLFVTLLSVIEAYGGYFETILHFHMWLVAAKDDEV